MLEMRTYKIMLAVVLIFFGCAARSSEPVKPEIAKPETIFKFTDTSFIEYNVYDPHNRIYHIRHSNRTDEMLGQLVADIISIDGVADIQVGRYSINIVKSPAYTWDEVQPEIRKCIEKLESAEPVPERPKSMEGGI